MMDASAHIRACHRCPHVQPRPYPIKRLCLLDGRDIIEHAEAGYCPAGRYKLGPGDVIAATLHITRLRRLWLWLRGPKNCGGCEQRQTWLNRQWQRLAAALKRLFGNE